MYANKNITAAGSASLCNGSKRPNLNHSGNEETLYKMISIAVIEKITMSRATSDSADSSAICILD